jgi:hypothetical protein
MTTRRYRRSIRLHEPAREGPPPRPRPDWRLAIPPLGVGALALAIGLVGLGTDPMIVGLLLVLAGGLAIGTAVRWGGAE